MKNKDEIRKRMDELATWNWTKNVYLEKDKKQITGQ